MKNIVCFAWPNPGQVGTKCAQVVSHEEEPKRTDISKQCLLSRLSEPGSFAVFVVAVWLTCWVKMMPFIIKFLLFY